METKVIPKVTASTPLKPSPEVLGTLINLVQQDEGSVDGLEELKDILNSRFNLSISLDDMINFYTPAIFTEEVCYLEQFNYGYQKEFNIIS